MKQHVNRYLFRLFGILWLLAVCPLSAVAADEETEEQEWREELCQELDRLCASPLFEITQLGLCVYDLTADTMLYTVNARQRMRPDSTMKLLTSITALSVLGGSHTFQTTLYHTGAVNNRVLQGDLYVVGGFDPRFGKDDLYAFVEEVKLRGVDSIAGTLYADVSFKDTLRWGEGWCWDDEAERLTPLLYQGKDCFMEQFVRALGEQGIASAGVTGQAVCPADAFYITKRAHAIDQILMPMMKESDNLYAESMFYQLAARSGVPYASARQALNHLQFISLIFTFRCFCLNCARCPPLLRYDGIGSRRAYRECGSYAWASGHQDHTDLCQGAAHHHRAPCHSPAAFNQLRHDRIFPLLTATFPTHGR